MDPLTISLIASAVGAGAGAIGSKIGQSKQKARFEKESKRRRKESKRETLSNLVSDAENMKAEGKIRNLVEKSKLEKRKALSKQDTADLVREALKI